MNASTKTIAVPAPSTKTLDGLKDWGLWVELSTPSKGQLIAVITTHPKTIEEMRTWCSEQGVFHFDSAADAHKNYPLTDAEYFERELACRQ